AGDAPAPRRAVAGPPQHTAAACQRCARTCPRPLPADFRRSCALADQPVVAGAVATGGRLFPRYFHTDRALPDLGARDPRTSLDDADHRPSRRPTRATRTLPP